jgi:hypothetical protein
MSMSSYTVTRSPIVEPAELARYSNEHVAYEIEMLFGAVLAPQGELRVSTPALGYFLSMARIETFVLHLRSLIGFFYPDHFRAQAGDLLAHHFVNDPDPWAKWSTSRPALSATLERAKLRADKEIAHLTKDRIYGVPAEKGWDFAGLGEEIRTLLDALVAAADPQRLGPRVTAVIPRGPLSGGAA